MLPPLARPSTPTFPPSARTRCFTDGEAEPRPAGIARSPLVHRRSSPKTALRTRAPARSGIPASGVLHLEDGLVPLREQAHDHAASRRRVLDGVVHEVPRDPAERLLVPGTTSGVSGRSVRKSRTFSAATCVTASTAALTGVLRSVGMRATSLSGDSTRIGSGAPPPSWRALASGRGCARGTGARPCLHRLVLEDRLHEPPDRREGGLELVDTLATSRAGPSRGA